MAAGLVGTSGFAAIPTTTLDLPLVQRLRRSPRFRVRVPKEIGTSIAESPGAGADEKGQQVALEGQYVASAAAAIRCHGDTRWVNRQQTMRLGAGVAFAQIGIVGFDGQIDLEALRLYGLPEAALALLCGTPALPIGQREMAEEVSWDLPSLTPGETSLLDVTVAGARAGGPRPCRPGSSTRFIELDVAAWNEIGACLVEQPASLGATPGGRACHSEDAH